MGGFSACPKEAKGVSDSVIAPSKVVGVKQTRRALAQRRAIRVYLGRDADPRLTEPLRAMCALAQVPVIDDMTMADLGKACGIAVGTAACAVLSE